MAVTALKKINAEAKRLHKKSPGRSYRSCQKEAGREYRAGKISGRKKKRPAKKKAAKKKTRRKVGASRQRVRVKNVEHFGVVGSLQSHKRAARDIIEGRLSKMLLQRDMASTKAKKKKLTKDITKLKVQLRGVL